MNCARTERRLSERDLFLEALDRPTPAERAAFLDEACAGDPALRAAVEALLRNHRQDSFLESPVVVRPGGEAADGARADSPTHGLIGEKPGDQIGRYKLLQQIGEGGVGVVFMAEQEAPVRRRVALKVLKPGMDTKSVIARFEAERQALALMDHPNIAKVLDAGSTASGRPYFVMELVRGVRITEYCDQHRLPTRERLALFIQVCHAIQHAHQKGIIHRDIKPSNILVTLHDGVPVPKVIDFGIAKALDQRLTDKTFFTEFRSFIGTPAYISPEQAEMSGLDIDTRTDIYSLGVLLYELLTGKTPFDAQELCSAGLEGMRRTIREREPAPPSTRLRLLPQPEQTTTAQRQQMEPARLSSLLKGDLDWIVLKALEKDRTRRYATASDLAQDIRRYLDNEPVLARPPSAAYRFQKLVRRNKLAFAGAGAFAAALLIGLALSTWQFVEKSAAYRRAVNAERAQSRLRQEADAARQAAEQQALAARRQAYAADMNLLQQALAANNLGRAQELLNRHRPQGAPEISNLHSQIQPDLRGWEWRYLWQHCQSDALFTLCRLSNEVSALSVSADGKWVAVAESGEGGVSIWDLRARQQLARFPAGQSGEPLAFSPVAPVLAFHAPDQPEGGRFRGRRGRVRLWDVAARRAVGEVPVGGGCDAIAFSADGTRLLTAGGDGQFALWNVADGRRLASVSAPRVGPPGEPPPYGGRVTVTPDLSRAARALSGGRVQVLDLTSGRELWAAPAADEHVTAVAFAPDGRTLATGAGFVESTVRLWDVASGREVARLEGHRTFVRELLFWPDGRTLASASGDQTIHLWDLRGLALAPAPTAPARAESAARSPAVPPRVVELRPSATLRGHQLEVWSLALCPDRTTLVSGSKDGTVLVWDTTSRRREHTHLTLPAPVRTWSFAPDSQALLALDEQGRIVRWQGVDFQDSQLLVELGKDAFGACFSADARFVAAVPARGSIHVWDLSQEGGAVRRLASEPDREVPIAFLARSQHLLTRQIRGGRLRTWDVVNGRVVGEWRLEAPGLAWKLVVSPDEHWLLTLDREGGARLHPLGGDGTPPLDLPLKQVSAAAFSPDGRWLAGVSVLGLGQLWDTTTRQVAASLQGFLQGMHGVAFSPDGQRLAIGSNGNEAIKLWDVASLQELLTLSGQGSIFGAVAFSPDGNLLAASNRQGTLHLWRAPSLAEIAHLEAKGL